MPKFTLRKTSKLFEVVCHEVSYFGKDLSIYMAGTDGGLLGEIMGEEDTYHMDTYVPPGSNVIDLGANVGVFSLACLARDCRVFAVEASPLNYALLSLNLRLFRESASSLLGYVGAAVVNVINFATNTEHFAGSNIKPHQPGHERWVYDPVQRVEPLRDFGVVCAGVPGMLCPKFHGGRQIVLKIDIEGSENGLFVPRFADFFKQVDTVLLEWHEYDGHVYAKYLEELGFDVILKGCGLPQPDYDKTFGRGMLYAKNRIVTY